MKTLGQIAYEGAHPTDYSFDMEGARIRMQWEAAAQAVRKAAIEECLSAIEARYMGDNNREDMEVKRCVEAIRALKDKP